MSHPLLEIRFEQELIGGGVLKMEVTRHWYHAPRAGDLIALQDIQGKVKSVTWLDEYIIVRLNGKVTSD